MTPMTNRVKVSRYIKVVTKDTNIFVFEVKVKICPESTCPEDQVTKMVLNGPRDR